MGNELGKLEGIKTVLSIGNLFNLAKDTTNQRFVLNQLSPGPVGSDAEMDSLKNQKTDSLPFYEGLLYKKESHATLMAINFDHKILNSNRRAPIIKTIREKADAFSKKNNIEVHYLGLTVHN